MGEEVVVNFYLFILYTNGYFLKLLTNIKLSQFNFLLLIIVKPIDFIFNTYIDK
jgi:hypothetical protein